jgi:hypothetical protein
LQTFITGEEVTVDWVREREVCDAQTQKIMGNGVIIIPPRVFELYCRVQEVCMNLAQSAMA